MVVPRLERHKGSSTRCWRGKKRRAGDWPVGRRFEQKIQAGVDVLGNPHVLILTPGQEADVTYAQDLVDSVPKPQVVIGNKGYDSKKLIGRLLAQGIETQIPSRKNAKEPRNVDSHVYKARNVVERFFSWIKQCRRVATRYDELDRNEFGFFLVTSIMVLLR